MANKLSEIFLIRSAGASLHTIPPTQAIAAASAPYVAMVVWFAPCFRQADYSLYVVPFFHSLQYLIFVYRVEDFEVHSHKQIMAERRWAFLAVGLIITGWLAFEAFPGNLDNVFGNERNFGFSFF